MVILGRIVMDNTFYNTFRPLILFSQVCGLMPVTGFLGNNAENLKFTWTNPMHLYDIGVSLVTLLFDVAFTIENFKRDISIDNFASTVFYTVCLLTTALFLRIARKLPELSEDMLTIERSMTDYEVPKRLGLTTKLFLLLFVLLATLEHGTMIVLHINRALEDARNGTDDFGHSFYLMHFPSVALIVPYSWFLNIIFTWANAICTLNWNFVDFFLVGISLQLSAKFNQITTQIKKLDNNSNAAWSKIYTDHGRIVALTKKVDKMLSGIILTSFFSNLYHLSLQLLRSLKIRGTLFHRLYFYFSLSYLILRLLTTLFCLANVNDAGKRPKDILFSMDKISVSCARFLQRVLTDDICFTGNRIFAITQGFVFSVIGTIITYQTVLLQFDSLTGVE